MKRRRPLRGFFFRSFFCILLLLSALPPATAQSKTPSIIKAAQISLRGEPLYKEGFTHFDYANPAAPKGGSLTRAALGSYDNFHRFALRGNCAAGDEYIYAAFMTGSLDESGSLYPYIAESIEYASDYSFIIFNINPNARDNGGEPLTAEDAAFSFRILFEKGVPQFRAYYAGVKASILSKYRIRFDIESAEGGNKELMMNIAQFHVFPRRFWEGADGAILRDFSGPLVEPPLGTGPYRIGDYKMGQYITLERVRDWWAADLPVNKGRYNFDTIRYDYYQDANVAFEALKGGEYDFRQENSAKNWASGYTGKIFEAGKNGEPPRIIRAELPDGSAKGMQSLVFNVQRPIFADLRVRRALNCFIDFNWMNKSLFYGLYRRTRSYFQNTEYEARGLPSAAELRELEALRGKVPPEVWTTEFQPLETDGSGYIRAQAREGLRLLAEAGWSLKAGKLVNGKGEPFSFEMLIYDTTMERVLIPLQNNLARYGIEMRIRLTDVSQFVNRLRSRDYDMISASGIPLDYPSSDLMILWHSSYIDSTWNTPGVMDGAVDYLCEQIAASQEDGERLLALGRVLDRVLTWNAYCIPEWHSPNYLIAYSSKFRRPAVLPKFDIGLDYWWVE
ncbi:MAG: extracellular solute-binding protein [Spirochaetaceae bacterium]|jgi:microcin C transport system substrate-binding protein|nr:extracellular solute-binding protein [Spirochaetaceae bacterium]